MTDVSGIPNMGFGGGGYFGGNAATGQPAMSADQINASMWGRYSPGQAQATLNNIYGAQGFGGLTNYYSALGAAYGRQTGGFGGGMSGSPSGTVERGTDLPDLSQDPFVNSNMGGVATDKWNTMTPVERASHNQAVVTSNIGNVDANKWSTMTPTEKFGHNQAVQRDMVEANPGNVAASKWSTMTPQEKWDHNRAVQSNRGGPNPYAGLLLGPEANPSYFNPGTYAGDQGNYGIPYNGRPVAGDIGFSRQPSYPNLGYNPGMGSAFANPGMNANPFQNRFGMGFPNAGTPSQYAPGAQMPPGFSQPYGADNEGGALPLSRWMNPNPGS